MSLSNIKSIIAGVVTSFLMLFFRDLVGVVPDIDGIFVNGTLNSTYVSAVVDKVYENGSILFASSGGVVVSVILSLFSIFYVIFKSNKAVSVKPNRYTQSLLPDVDQVIGSQIIEGVTEDLTIAKSTVVAPVVTESSIIHSTADKLYGLSFPFKVFDVTTTQITGATLVDLTSADILRAGSLTLRSIPKRLFEDWRFLSFDIRVTVTVSGNPMASGLLVMCGRPNDQPIRGSYNNTFTGPPALTYALNNIISNDHVVIDLSRDGVYTVDLPFTSIYDWLCLEMMNKRENAGHQRLLVSVLSPYVAPIGASNTLQITMVASMVNIVKLESRHLATQSLPFVYPFSRFAYFYAKYFSWLVSFYAACCYWCEGPGDNIPFNSTPATQSGLPVVSSTFRRVFNNLVFFVVLCCERCVSHLNARYSQSFISIGEKSVNVTAQHMNDANLASNMTGDAVNAHGMDAPADTRNYFGYLSKSFQKLFYRKGTTDVFRITNDPSVVQTIDEADAQVMRVPKDQSTMENFRDRYVFLGNTPYKPSSIRGDILVNFPIAPILHANPTFCSIASLADFYDYWRGSIKFRFILAANDYARGKICIAVQYGNVNYGNTTNWTTAGQIDPHTVWHMIVDVSNPDRIIEVDIPYKSVYPLLRTCNSIFDPSVSRANFGNCMGTISVSTYTPLVFSNGTAGTVTISSMYAWGSDFELLSDRSLPIAYSESTMMVEPAPPLTRVLNNFSKMASIRDLLMKPVRYTVCNVRVGSTSVPSPSNVIPLNPALLPNNAEWSYAFASYAGYKGSIRWIVRILQQTPGATPIRATVHSNVQLKNTTLVFGADPAAFWDDGGTNNPGAFEPDGSTIVGMRYNRTAWSSSNTTAICGPYASRPDILLSAVTQPEAVFEVPCGCPQYRYIPCRMIPVNTTITTIEQALTGVGYSPLVDEASAILTLCPAFNPINSNQTTSVEIYCQAGDDFELLHYTGGPTVATVGALTITQGIATTAFEDPRTINYPAPLLF
jgi:hypothetical protein